MAERLRSYAVARKIFSILEFVGWAGVVLGVCMVLTVFTPALQYGDEIIKLGLLAMGIASSLTGLFFVGSVQSWRADVDSAEYGQQALKIARDQLEISRQGLKHNGTGHSSFADVASESEAQETGSAFRQEPPVKTEPRAPGGAEEAQGIAPSTNATKSESEEIDEKSDPQIEDDDTSFIYGKLFQSAEREPKL